MIRKIYKHVLKAGQNELQLPPGTDILKFGPTTIEKEDPNPDGVGGSIKVPAVAVWVAQDVTPERAPSSTVKQNPDTLITTYITVCATGETIKFASNQYIDTAFLSNGEVWHAFNGQGV